MTVTAAAGFVASGVSAGIKGSGGKDVALIVNTGPQYCAAGVFTANRVQAAPVRWSRQVLKGVLESGQPLNAVVLNSGGANACTGPKGFQDTHSTAERVATHLETGAASVAVCSTGLIGEYLPMEALLPGVDEAAATLSADGGADAAAAIMTTDTVAKSVAIEADGYIIGGIAKGAGMLAPGMATMLCVLTTDAVVDSSTADEALREACRVSFDRLDSDGAMSTNDTVLLLASGASGVAADPDDFTRRLTRACRDLAMQLLGDAEGATKEVAITVTGAAREDDAVAVARAVARNNLVKCALFGQDPNWGRILAAVGTTEAMFDPDELDVAVNDVWICRKGTAAADRSTVDLSGREVSITVALGAGEARATVWTNDLSHAYVHENSAYSS